MTNAVTLSILMLSVVLLSVDECRGALSTTSDTTIYTLLLSKLASFSIKLIHVINESTKLS
jgi:hypothetical protein